MSPLMTFYGSRNPPWLRSRALVMAEVRLPEGAIARVGAAGPSAWILDAAHAMFATGLDALRRSSLVGGDSVFPSLFVQLGAPAVYRPPKAACREGRPPAPMARSWPRSGSIVGSGIGICAP